MHTFAAIEHGVSYKEVVRRLKDAEKDYKSRIGQGIPNQDPRFLRYSNLARIFRKSITKHNVHEDKIIIPSIADLVKELAAKRIHSAAATVENDIHGISSYTHVRFVPNTYIR
jgi:hypothetical protein